VLPDRWISRNHAMLQRMETGEFYLIDLGSRNGSFVNGRRVSVPVTLQNGDHLTFGQTELDFYAPDADPLTNPSVELDSQEFTATATLHVRRLISVLVVDIRNFTGMTRQLDEKILSEVIGTWFRCAGDIIREYGSWVDKYIGDAVMAVWIHGAQGISAEEMIRITRALSALNTMSSELHERYPLPFPLRIGAGLNTGYAMVGNTGTGDRPDYTALGDTVNAAFRLETATKQLGSDIALGEATYQYLEKSGISPALFQQHMVSLKGYETPTLTYAGSFKDLDAFLQLVPKN
jgi:adenylate cyclase